MSSKQKRFLISNKSCVSEKRDGAELILRHELSQSDVVHAANEDELRAYGEGRAFTEEASENGASSPWLELGAKHEELVKELSFAQALQLRPTNRAHMRVEIDRQRRANQDLLERLLSERRATFRWSSRSSRGSRALGLQNGQLVRTQPHEKTS